MLPCHPRFTRHSLSLSKLTLVTDLDSGGATSPLDPTPRAFGGGV